MKFLIASVLLMLSVSAFSQTPVTVKPSPASEALVHAAQDLQTQQKSLDTLLNQARSTIDMSQKSLQDALQKANTELMTELKNDKKYKDKLNAIFTMQAQLQDLGQKSSQRFNQEAAPFQNEINRDRALIEGLTAIVRKENDLAATATFDPVAQKWTAPKVADKPAETKK